MPFIPRADRLEVGDRVRLTRNVANVLGTFTKDTEMTVVGNGERGYDFVDDQGNGLRETILQGVFYEKTDAR